MVAKITAVLKLIRVRQWVKNLFVFAPLVFSLQLFNAAPCLQAVTAFFAFCLVSGSVCHERYNRPERDKHHPQKTDLCRPVS